MCKSSLAKPLKIIWQSNFNRGTTPLILKTSHITPIFKSGDQGAPGNYRPVALTSITSKIFEKIVRKKMHSYLEDKNLYNSSQHGFRPGRSCLSQLLAHVERLTSNLQNDENVDAIYLDFSKAFDKVDHAILLHKLQNIGIRGQLLNWLKSFLTDRVQKVSVNTFLSYESTVISGVPQGSVLGPVLFLIMISDIDENVKHSILSSFADDTRLMKSITAAADIVLLQEDLDSVYEWTTKNNMSLNGTKFVHLPYGKNQELMSCSTYHSDTGEDISTKDTVKDLGVLFSNDLTYNSHIQMIVNKVKNISSWVYRTFKTREQSTMLTLWKSLVIPHLDYCSQLWSPSKRLLMQDLEKLQKSFLKGVELPHNLNYWEKLKYLSLYSLERRRERYQIIYTWCIIEGLVPNFNYEDGKGGIYSYMNLRLGRKCHLKSVNTKHRNIWKGCLSDSGPRLFNILPKNLRNTTNCSKLSFKLKLDRFLQDVPDEPLLQNYLCFRRADSNSLVEMVKHRTPRVG